MNFEKLFLEKNVEEAKESTGETETMSRLDAVDWGMVTSFGLVCMWWVWLLSTY